MMENWKCPRCGNQDKRFFGVKNKKPYCRRCITFQGEEVIYTFRQIKEVNYELSYPLSKEQVRASKKIVDEYQKGNHILVHAVCGAGKTELVYPVISKALSEGKRVGFAIPRKDVVIELYPRLCSAFKEMRITAVFGGHHEKLQGDIILITTHQLYRYPHYFDLLIVDEIDAFPFQNNAVLLSFFEKSVRGNYIWMSATPSKKLYQTFSTGNHTIVQLMTRFHGKPLPIPRIQIHSEMVLFGLIVNKLQSWKKENKPAFIFVPTIEQCEKLYQRLSIFVKNGNYVHARKDKKEQIIQDFKDGKIDYLVTTSILERGVTIRNLQVIVYHADHMIYNSQTLIQIAGRVGRKIDATDGEVWFYAEKISEEMQLAQNEIMETNKNL